MILDAGDEVYVWVGSESDENEKVRGVDMAKKYLDADPTTRFVNAEFQYSISQQGYDL